MLHCVSAPLGLINRLFLFASPSLPLKGPSHCDQALIFTEQYLHQRKTQGDSISGIS